MALALLSCCLTLVAAQAQVQPASVAASARVYDRAGRLVATASFREATDEVLVNLAFPDRSALIGTHAIQIHESGRCDPPDFSSAGGVFNPFGNQHGLLNPDGPMAGDLPSLVIGPAGVGGYNLAARLVKVSTGPAALLRPGGAALVIFERSDDGLSQPEGNAGARIACGVIVAGTPGGSGSAPTPARFGPATSPDDQRATLLVGGLGVLLIGAGLLLRRLSVRAQ